MRLQEWFRWLRRQVQGNVLWDAAKWLWTGYLPSASGLIVGITALLSDWGLAAVLLAGLGAMALGAIIVRTLTAPTANTSPQRPDEGQRRRRLQEDLIRFAAQGRELVETLPPRWNTASPSSRIEYARHRQIEEDVVIWRDRVYGRLRVYDPHEARHFFNCPDSSTPRDRMLCYLERLDQIIVRLPQP